MSELKLCKAARARAKGSITRLKNSFDKKEYLEAPLEFVIVKRQRLVETFNEYERLSVKLTALLVDSGSADEIEGDDDVEDNYIHLLALLDGIINLNRQNSAASQGTMSSGPGNIKLPTVVIPVFSVVKQNLAALRNLGESVETWDSIVICVLSRKLDSVTYRAFQLDRDAEHSPTVGELIEYLEKRAQAIETTDCNTQKVQRLVSHPVAAKVLPPASSCIYCKSTDHKLYMCPAFKLAATKKRLLFANTNNLCHICLSQHKRKCKFHFRCAVCKLEHNTLLHDDIPIQDLTSVTMSVTSHNQGQVLLPTARVKLVTESGMIIYARALLDSASQTSFITQKVVDILGKSMHKANTAVIGITNTTQTVDKCINLDVHSTVYPFKVNVNCHVVKTITTKLPQTQLDMSHIKLPSNCKLADEDFNKPGDVHLLLGADIFFQILLPQPQSDGDPARSQLVTTAGRDTAATTSNTPPGSPSLVHTSFGLVVAGRMQTSAATNNQVVTLFCRECDTSISKQLSAFWETEKVPEIFPEQLPEHEYCENLFRETTKLDNNKYQVSMPIKVPLEQINSELGESFHLALNRFINLEKKLHKNPALFSEYKKFIDQYLELKHGEYRDISSFDLSKDPVYFLPHHAVINESSRSTRLRTVFDGSMLTNKKVSLNDMLLNGPVVQKDLFDILLQLRMDRFFFVCDIKKMFRCIEIDPAQRSLQNILWRESLQQDVKCIQLNTVTYGLKSSSWLATRCLNDLAKKHEDSMPLASSAIKNNTYVDDILVSCSTEQELLLTQSQLTQMLGMGSFQLHKWASNCRSILANVPQDSQHFGEVELQGNDAYMKTLGVHFDVKYDVFKSACPEPYTSKNDSKRDILSYISKFYDPLGTIGPIFVRAKLIMQELHTANLAWDSTPPDNIRSKWTAFVKDLSEMQPVVVQRCVKPEKTVVNQLIGFADSSSVAYGCCVYLRSIDENGNVRVELLCSKSRINPCRSKLTTPRLELNAALLLSCLMKKVHNAVSLKVNIHAIYLFSDSQIVLAWLKTDPTKLQTYVANRVRSIRQLAQDYIWHYVNTDDNPSDCLSRGLQPQEIHDHSLWWHGPTFLHDRQYNFPDATVTPGDLPELKIDHTNVLCLATTVNNADVFDILKKFSSIGKMTRVLAYILRFCNNVKSSSQNVKGFLTALELTKALMLLVKYEQAHFYCDEIKLLQAHKLPKGDLRSLTPFLDSEGILRVGGRLQNAPLPYAAQHPAILPKKSVITELIVRNEHICLQHADQRLVLSSLRQRFWIPDGLRSVKKVIHKCVICFRLKAAVSTQLMGSLPASRVTACRPYERVGVDFAGPVSVKNSRIRKPVVGKGYIAL